MFLIFSKHAMKTPINYCYLIKDVILAKSDTFPRYITTQLCTRLVFRNKEFSFFPMQSTMYLLRNLLSTKCAKKERASPSKKIRLFAFFNVWRPGTTRRERKPLDLKRASKLYDWVCLHGALKRPLARFLSLLYRSSPISEAIIKACLGHNRNGTVVLPHHSNITFPSYIRHAIKVHFSIYNVGYKLRSFFDNKLISVRFMRRVFRIGEKKI